MFEYIYFLTGTVEHIVLGIGGSQPRGKEGEVGGRHSRVEGRLPGTAGPGRPRAGLGTRVEGGRGSTGRE